MTVPPSLTFLIAGMVILFGVYRLTIAFRDRGDSEHSLRRKGLYAQPRRRHFLFGVIYLILGGLLIAGALGYSILPPMR